MSIASDNYAALLEERRKRDKELREEVQDEEDVPEPLCKRTRMPVSDCTCGRCDGR